MSGGPENKARTARIEAEKQVSAESYTHGHTGEVDMANLAWDSTSMTFRWAVMYEDRPLRRRERLMMWLFHRRDPRLIGTADFDQEGE